MNATALTSKLVTWENRDKAISDGYARFNNEISKKYAADKDVRIGSKNQRNFGSAIKDMWPWMPRAI